MAETEILANVVFNHCAEVWRSFNQDPPETKKKILIEQGGTRSGKTYNVLMWIVFGYCAENTGKVISIVRKTSPSLTGTVARDFFEILQNHGLYDEALHNKTEKTYRLNGNLIEFLALDQSQKIRGRKRDLLFCNEANELIWEEFFQLLVRTTGMIIVDYNPSDMYHWLYSKLKPRTDAAFHITTFRDNPFLPPELVKEILLLQDTDETLWTVYGLGEKGENKAIIFSKVEEIERIPEDAKLHGRGLDFGYTADPTAVVAIYTRGNEIYLDEEFYEYGASNADIAKGLQDQGVGKYDDIRADPAEPKSIDDLKDMGLKVVPAKKGKDSVRNGIDRLKRYKIFITTRSKGLRREFRAYKWKEDKDGNITNEPIDAWNHAIDATRYGTETLGKRRSKAKAGTY